MRGKRAAIFILLGIFLTIYIPKFLSPISQLDGSWYYSQAAAIVSGDFFFNTYTQTNMPLFYGWLQAPIALVFSPITGIKVFYGLFTLGVALYLCFQLKNRLFLLLPLLLLIDHTFLLHRPEPVILTLGIILHQWLIGNKAKPWIMVLIGVLIIAVHPVNGLLVIAALFTYHGHLFKLNMRYVLLAVSGLVAVVAFTMLWPDHIYSSTLIHRLKNISHAPFLKFAMYSGLTLIALVYMARNWFNQTTIINYIILFTLITLLGGYYYYLFLAVPLILSLLNQEIKAFRVIPIGLAIAFGLLVNVFHPNYVQLENPDYDLNATRISNVLYLPELGEIEVENSHYVENDLGPCFYYVNGNIKMMLIDKNQVFLAGTGLQKDEVLFITSNTELIQVKKHLESKGIAYEVNNPIKAVKGNLTLRSGYRQRTDHLGLWQLKILSVP